MALKFREEPIFKRIAAGILISLKKDNAATLVASRKIFTIMIELYRRYNVRWGGRQTRIARKKESNRIKEGGESGKNAPYSESRKVRWAEGEDGKGGSRLILIRRPTLGNLWIVTGPIAKNLTEAVLRSFCGHAEPVFLEPTENSKWNVVE